MLQHPGCSLRRFRTQVRHRVAQGTNSKIIILAVALDAIEKGRQVDELGPRFHEPEFNEIDRLFGRECIHVYYYVHKSTDIGKNFQDFIVTGNAIICFATASEEAAFR